MSNTFTYGFIGAGNMGFPLLKGAVELKGADSVTFFTPVEAEVNKVKSASGARPATGNVDLVRNSKNIVFCVKPQIIGSVFKELADAFESGEISAEELESKTFISIAAGVSCEKIRDGLKKKVRIVRIMPNTPAMVNEGMSCICFDEDGLAFNDEQKCDVLDLFNKVGRVEVIPERLMNAAICANGSSPAYVYMFIEALADSVVKYGVPRDMAYRLVAQTVLGSAKMVLESGEHPGKLKDNVCSPGGTTIVAVEALEEFGMRNAVMKATDACYAKSEELENKK